MSVIVAKLFSADMSDFKFVFSKDACIKTGIYFAVMYIAVIFFNTITVSRYKLINLLNASKKNEKIKLKNPISAIFVFICGIAILSVAYWKVTAGASTITADEQLLIPILMGIIGTVAVFWSLSGFILQIIQTMKNVYLKDTNMFVLRQINSKINTMVASMSVICIMLFLTITILSSSLALRQTMERELLEMTPVDLNLYKTANLPESYIRYGNEVNTTSEQRDDSKIKISETLKNNGFDINLLKDVIEIPIYTYDSLTWSDFFIDKLEEIKSKFPMLRYDTKEEIIKISDYNKIANLYGIDEYILNDDEYIVLCDFESMKAIRNNVLASGNHTIEVAGKQYKSKYKECKEGFVLMSTSHTNTGIILVPDSCNLEEYNKKRHVLVANYNATDDDKIEEINKLFTSGDSGLIQNLADNGIEIDGITKISIFDASIGIATMVTFIAIYLGFIFLVASSAILALKQLTESADNKQRYTILRKIGCDENMINKSLFMQIGIFFGLPLVVAIIHSIFGIQFVLTLLSGIASKEDLLPSIIATVVVMGVIYGSYFLATYFGSKNIIKSE